MQIDRFEDHAHILYLIFHYRPFSLSRFFHYFFWLLVQIRFLWPFPRINLLCFWLLPHSTVYSAKKKSTKSSEGLTFITSSTNFPQRSSTSFKFTMKNCGNELLTFRLCNWDHYDIRKLRLHDPSKRPNQYQSRYDSITRPHKSLWVLTRSLLTRIRTHKDDICSL